MIFDNSYFEDEVRDGFFVPAEIKQAWAAELEVLSEVDKICKKHHIQYFADWGTLLATVRHEGFIPWDDDLDIVMKRDDYNRFMKLAQTELPEGYSAYNFRNHDDFWLFLGRVVGKRRICFEEEHLERFHQFPYIAGVDIFVLDYVSRDVAKEEKRDKLALRTIALADMIGDGKLNDLMREHELQKLEMECDIKISRELSDVELRRELYTVVELIFSRFTDEESDRLSQLFPHGLRNPNFRFPKECYEAAIELPYECTRIPVPIQYCKMLKRRYGNYMELVRNAGGHDYPFFELQKKQLQAVLDFDMPSYRFTSEQLNCSKDKNGYKNLLRDAFEKLQQMANEIEPQFYESREAGEMLSQMQQLVIDMGSLIENIKGEGTETVTSLEQLCEVIYQMSIGTSGMDVKEYIDESKKTFEREILCRKEVVFIVHKSEEWKYVQWYFNNTKNIEKMDVYIVAVPYYYKKYDGTCYDAKYELKKIKQVIRSFNGTDENVVDYEQFDIALHHPDIIVIQNPCDEWNNTITLAKDYYSSTLQKLTDKLVYIQSFKVEEFTEESYREWHNMKYYCTMPGVVRADEVYVQSENMRRLYIEKLSDFAGKATRDNWESKVYNMEFYMKDNSQRDNLIQTIGEELSCRKKIAFYVQIGSIIEYGNQMIKKLQSVIEVFASRRDTVEIVWVCDKEHEMYLCNYDEKLAAGYMEIKKRILCENIGECIYREENNVAKIVRMCDAYYGSEGCIGLEFMLAKKPGMIMNVDML